MARRRRWSLMRRVAVHALGATVAVSCARSGAVNPPPEGARPTNDFVAESANTPSSEHPSTSSTLSDPAFRATIAPIDEATSIRMRASWRPGCPVPLARLRYVTVRHWGFDGAAHDGEIVVHESHAAAVVDVFAQLFADRFPIERMQLVDDFAADDAASMRMNNTSAFNCREVSGRPGVMSTHSWGSAIDINPRVNPWVKGAQVDPPEGAGFVDRSRPIVGGVFRDGVVVRAFRGIGWGWGGDWSDSVDWQHFSATGD